MPEALRQSKELTEADYAEAVRLSIEALGTAPDPLTERLRKMPGTKL